MVIQALLSMQEWRSVLAFWIKQVLLSFFKFYFLKIFPPYFQGCTLRTSFGAHRLGDKATGLCRPLISWCYIQRQFSAETAKSIPKIMKDTFSSIYTHKSHESKPISSQPNFAFNISLILLFTIITGLVILHYLKFILSSQHCFPLLQYILFFFPLDYISWKGKLFMMENMHLQQ